MQVGDQLLDGKVIIVTVDQQGNALSFKLPSVKDPSTGEPQVITLFYGATSYQVEQLAAVFLG